MADPVRRIIPMPPSAPKKVVRIKSTFAPRVCIGCYWEAMYNSLQRQHRQLRANLVKGAAAARRATREHDDEDTIETPDLVQILGHAHDR